MRHKDERIDQLLDLKAGDPRALEVSTKTLQDKFGDVRASTLTLNIRAIDSPTACAAT